MKGLRKITAHRPSLVKYHSHRGINNLINASCLPLDIPSNVWGKGGAADPFGEKESKICDTDEPGSSCALSERRPIKALAVFHQFSNVCDFKKSEISGLSEVFDKVEAQYDYQVF